MPSGRSRAGSGHSRMVNGGFAYIALLIAVAIIGTTLAEAGVIWHTALQREKERQLLFVGDQIRLAIGRYYNAGGAKEFPQNLTDLLQDPRQPSVQRYLRKIYYDPITGTAGWGLITDANDRIVGVFSLSEERPIKRANFSAVDRQFEAKEKYTQWRFVYRPSVPRKHREQAALGRHRLNSRDDSTAGIKNGFKG